MAAGDLPGTLAEEGVGGGVECAGVEGVEAFRGAGPQGEMGGASVFLIREKRRVLACINIRSLTHSVNYTAASTGYYE